MAIAAPQLHASSRTRILLVEDNDISRQLLGDYLNDCGYDVLSLAEARSFASVLTQFKPDLILLDIKLPYIDGYALLQQLQQVPEWRRIPVIVVSAYAFRADQQRALKLGARRYLVKPIKLSELTQAISEEITCSLFSTLET
ncbi:MAG: response regulator [Leptolyngbyaceae cyanobacterium RU_5_1]|nr:response regulator [Leptolyngbyaceae cyanobacterium RU_5_1]